MERRCTSTGLSLPIDMMDRIDEERGDIPRSRFLLRLLEKIYPELQVENKEQSEVAVAK